MDGYAYSYPESGDSSPRSREIDFDNSSHSWEDPPPPSSNLKLKFLVSYGGKIQARPHDNLLSYLGGHTKILAVDRSITFPSLLSKLSSLLSDDPSILLSSFKYQLPGEDLDSLISVSNDDDLLHLIHEFDRLYRASSKPARFRLFLFPGQQPGFGEEPGKLDPDHQFGEALNPPQAPVPGGNNNVDFLFGLDNKGHVPVHHSDQVVGSDPQIESRVQELNRLQISTQEQVPPLTMYHLKRGENVGGYSGDGYQKPTPTIQAGYLRTSLSDHQQPQQLQQPLPPQQHQVYMIHAPHTTASVYHPSPVVRSVTGQPPHGYYQVHQVPSDPVYMEKPLYNVTMPAPASIPGGYSEGMGIPARTVAGRLENSGGYQVAYDSATGRQLYYTEPVSTGVGVVTAPFQAVGTAGVSNDVVRPAGGLEGKVVRKVLPTSPV